MKKIKEVSNERIKFMMEMYSNGVPIYISSSESAAIIGITNSALENRRFRKEGPCYLKIGHLIRYRLDEVISWMNHC